MWKNIAILVVLAAGSGPAAAQILVSELGAAGWFADDSRNASGVDLVGRTFTQLGRPGQVATADDDLALVQRLNFTADPSTPNGRGTLTFVLDALPGQKSKSTLALVNGAGFGAASLLAGGDFHATYVWAESAAQSWNNLAFRFGLQSSHYGTGEGQSQAGFTATRTGESVWDVILVYVPPTGPAGVWQTAELTAATSGWKVYFQSENTFWQTHYGLSSAAGPLGTAHSLAYWQDYDYDPDTAGVQSFFDDALITSIQFGLGAATGRQGEAYLASFETSLLADGYVFAAVPEPAATVSIAAAAVLAAALVRRRLLQRQTG